MKTIRNISIISAFIITGLVCIIYNHQAKGYLEFVNSIARCHYNSFHNGLIDYNNILPVLKNGEHIIYGESFDYEYYIAYASESVENDTLLFGTKNKEPNNYWAVRIIDGEIIEVWTSSYPLKENQLCNFTKDEQLKQLSIFEKFSTSDVVGHFRYN